MFLLSLDLFLNLYIFNFNKVLNNPKITIITAGFNSAATIRDTLDCIASQTYSNIEHVIIDGASKDDTLKIVSEFPHVAKIISEPDKGIYDAMNKGIQLATGDIIGILNSDDFYADKYSLENVADAFIKYDVESCYADLQYVNEKNTSKVVRNWISGKFNRFNFLQGWMPPHPTFFVRKEVYEKYGNFDLELNSAADYELMLRFLYKQRISTYYIPKILVKMRTGGQSNASIKNRFKANREDKLAWKKNDLKPKFYTTWLKPIRKINQYFNK